MKAESCGTLVGDTRKGFGMRLVACKMGFMLCFALPLCPAANAWGPKADTAIVVASSNQLMRSANVPLKSFSKELQEGASLPKSSLLELYPSLDVDFVSSIESEMSLLQSVRGQEMDPYYAYRLGALGKMVSLATSPMQEASNTYRELYFSDVEANIENISLTPKERRAVVPRDYFRELALIANQNNELIERAYQNGTGFEGVPLASLPDHASRSVDAVTDVWFTLLTGNSGAGDVSLDQKERYVLDAYRFYIERKKISEIDSAALRLEKVTGLSVAMRTQVAGYFYDAEMYDRAIQEYESVLAQDPFQKDAQGRIAEYYLMKGEEALDAEKYDDAQKYFRQAASADPLNSRGEEMRLHAEDLISMRATNYDSLREQMVAAGQKVDLAETEAHNGHYAEAIALMAEAVVTFNGINDEFPDLAQEKLIAVRRVNQRMEDLRRGLMQSVSSFSGKGYTVDINSMARSMTGSLEQEGLQRMIQSELDKELAALEMEIAGSFKIE